MLARSAAAPYHKRMFVLALNHRLGSPSSATYQAIKDDPHRQTTITSPLPSAKNPLHQDGVWVIEAAETKLPEQV